MTDTPTFARYNQWANERVFSAIATLDDEAYRRDVGLFFGSIHRTLNHLLVADRIWMYRLTGKGPTYDKLDLILHVLLFLTVVFPHLARSHREYSDRRARQRDE